MNDDELRLQIIIDDNKASNSIKSLSKQANDLGKAFQNAGKKLTVGLTLPIAGLITMGVNYNATIEQLQTSFEVMTGSADEAKDIIQKLKKVGAKTPYELSGLAKTTQILMQYGMTSEQAYDATVNLGDIAQGSAEKMESIALAYGQMSSAGKVNMQDIKQMINAGFNPLQAIVDKTGKSMAQVVKEYEEGKISVEDVTLAMRFASSEQGRYYQSMEKQSGTVSGKLSTLKDNFNEAAGELTTTLLPVLVRFIDKLTDLFKWFTDLDESQQNTILTILGIAAAIGPLLTIIGTLIKTFGLLSGAIGLSGLGGLLTTLGLIAALAVIAVTISIMVKGLKEAQAAVDAVTELRKSTTGRQEEVSKQIGASGDEEKIKKSVEAYYRDYTSALNRKQELQNKLDNMGFIEKIAGGSKYQQLINDQQAVMDQALKSITNLGPVGISHFQTMSKGSGGRFAKGTNYIENDGIALLHKGEAVIPSKYNPYAKGQAYNTNSSAINNNFEIGSLNVRNDNDINLIAEQLYYLQKKEVV